MAPARSATEKRITPNVPAEAHLNLGAVAREANMQEIWKDVVGYEGLYEVSNLGRIRSLDRVVAHHTAGTAVRKGKMRCLSFDGNYLNVSLSRDGKTVTRRVHRVVAEAFIPNPNNYSDVDHIDCNKLNNHIDNLRWCTSADNTKYAWENGLIHQVPYRERPLDVQEKQAAANRRAVIRSDGKWYKSTTDAAKDLGVSRGAVSHVLRGLNETCQGYSFTYAEKEQQ